MGTAGRYSTEMDQLSPATADKKTIGLPDYSDDYVASLTKEVITKGNAMRGEAIYANPVLSCAGCHKIGENGGIFGPELTAVGAGLPVELIIEAVLWPTRQVKEGYLATTLNLKDGEDQQRMVLVYTVPGSADNCLLWPTGRGNLLRNGFVP